MTRESWTGFKGGMEIIGLKVRDSPSGLAVLVKIEEIDGETLPYSREKWIPYSQIEAGKYDQVTKEYKIIVADWLGLKLHEELT